MITLVFLLLNLVPGKGRAQQNSVDSLELRPLINKVIQSYPTIQQAAEAVNAAELRIALARTSNLPTAMATGSFAHVGPVPTLTLPDVGSFSLAPRDNMNASVSINQTLSDFGKTRLNIAYEEKSKQLIAMGLDQVRQKLSLAVINCYYRLLYLQEAAAVWINCATARDFSSVSSTTPARSLGRTTSLPLSLPRAALSILMLPRVTLPILKVTVSAAA